MSQRLTTPAFEPATSAKRPDAGSRVLPPRPKVAARLAACLSKPNCHFRSHFACAAANAVEGCQRNSMGWHDPVGGTLQAHPSVQ